MKNSIATAVATFCFATSVFLFSAKPPSSTDSLGNRILADLQSLSNQAFFPQGFNSLKKIRLLIHSKENGLKKTLINSVQLPFTEKDSGTHSLQIDVIENLEPNNEALIILQFNLFENETQNKIWEASRSYELTTSEVEELKPRSGQAK